MSQGAYAKHRGISQPRVAALIKSGRLDGAWKKKKGRYLIYVDKADEILQPQVIEDPAPVSPAATVPAPIPPARAVGDLVSFSEAARLEKVARAALLDLELKKTEGELIERARVKAAAAEIAQVVRAGLEAIPSKTAPTVAGMTTAAEVAVYLQAEIKTVLNDLSEEIKGLDF